MEGLENLSFFEQLCRFKDRGMSGIDIPTKDEADTEIGNKKQAIVDKSVHTLEHISYYELKRYSYPFYDMVNKQYTNISFPDLVARYYRDKRLRDAVLQAIEDIEVSLNTNISFVLGKKFGPLGYLDFSKWCQKNKKNRYLKDKYMDKFAIKSEQLKFLSQLQYKIKKSSMIEVKTYLKRAGEVFPPVWIMVNVLTLGDSIHLLKLMSNSSKREVAKRYGITYDVLIKWLDCLNLVRNICCHNGNLIDFSLITEPPVPNDYRDELVYNTEDNKWTRKLAMTMFIITSLLRVINPKYRYGSLISAVIKFVPKDDGHGDEYAMQYGFTSREAIKHMNPQNRIQ